MTATELQRLRSFLEARTGLSYGESKRYYVERRVADRMARTASPSVGAYLHLVAHDAAEAGRLINSFTVNETYFFREEHQLQALSRAMLPELAATRGAGDLIRIWSVPCASGEEPYSIAIWLLEHWPLVDAYNIEIVGSDIDTDILRDAAHGAYGQRALARLPPELRRRYFEPAPDDTSRIIADLRQSVQFVPANLVDAASMAAQGRFDVIFCRNVLIYFDAASRVRAADHLWEALAPGGFACLGHTESLSRTPGRFRVRRFADAVVYQRPAGPQSAAAAPGPDASSWRDPEPAASTGPNPAPRAAAASGADASSCPDPSR